ncbi:MAG: VTT domain-containing protein [Caulobacterales bacterium]
MTSGPASLWSKITSFFLDMDSRAVRALWVSAILFAVAGAVLALGMTFLDVNQGGIADFLRGARSTWWSPFFVTAVFTVLAFVGAPQIALIAGTVVVFGPAEGSVLSWVATMISAAVGFALGRAAGAKGLAQMGSVGRRASRFMGKNGFLAALIIRLVPSAPFVVINMALGAAKLGWTHFIGGTGIGILPKIMLVAFAGHGFDAVARRENLTALAFFAAAAFAWLLIVFVVRPRIKSHQHDQSEQDRTSDP